MPTDFSPPLLDCAVEDNSPALHFGDYSCHVSACLFTKSRWVRFCAFEAHTHTFFVYQRGVISIFILISSQAVWAQTTGMGYDRRWLGSSFSSVHVTSVPETLRRKVNGSRDNIRSQTGITLFVLLLYTSVIPYLFCVNAHAWESLGHAEGDSRVKQCCCTWAHFTRNQCSLALEIKLAARDDITGCFYYPLTWQFEK